jgi:hypothetical protein
MKILHIIPLLLLAGGITVGAQTTNTPPHTKTMSYTLRNLQNDKAIPNPTDADIKATVASLKDDFGPVLALEIGADDQPLSMDEIAKGKFGFSCVDGKTAYFTKEGHECSAEVAIKIIISYRDGTPDWKTLGEWKQGKM